MPLGLGRNTTPHVIERDILNMKIQSENVTTQNDTKHYQINLMHADGKKPVFHEHSRSHSRSKMIYKTIVHRI